MQHRLAFFASLLFVTVLGCSSDSDGSGYPSTTVKDKLGRTCVLGEGGSVTCDKPPAPAAACKSTATACFMVGSLGGVGQQAAICAGCCEGNTGSSVQTDCVAITCATNADCPKTHARCMTGVCNH